MKKETLASQSTLSMTTKEKKNLSAPKNRSPRPNHCRGGVQKVGAEDKNSVIVCLDFLGPDYLFFVVGSVYFLLLVQIFSFCCQLRLSFFLVGSDKSCSCWFRLSFFLVGSDFLFLVLIFFTLDEVAGRYIECTRSLRRTLQT